MSFIISAVGNVASAFIGADASRSAANKQFDAAKLAQETQWNMFQQNQANLAPWRQAGQRTLPELMQYLGLGGAGGFDPNAPGVRRFGMADFQQDPGYQFRQSEGQRALLNQRSALGGLGGGNTAKALLEYGQGLASNEYGNAYNRYNTDIGNVYSRLSGMSNTGVNAAGSIAGLGANAANQIGQYQLGAGNALAGGAMGAANAYGGGLAGISNAYLIQQLLNRNRDGGGAFNYWGNEVGSGPPGPLPQYGGYDFGGQ